MQRFEIIVIIFLAFVLLQKCKKELTTEGSRQFSIRVVATDTSFVTRQIGNTKRVAGAELELHSVNYSISYKAVTDSDGVALISNIIPDIYNCSAKKDYSREIVKEYIGLQESITLVGTVSSVALSDPGDSLQILLKPVFASNLVISEIYYNGAPPPPPYYYHDQFTEIYNNSSDTVYLDGYAIGDASYSSRGDPQYLHCVHLYQFPGGGHDYPIPPGGIKIIAQDAIDHTEYDSSSIDLSRADFEYYNHLSNDVDGPNAVNMIQIHHKYGYDFLYSVMNDAIVLFKLEKSDTLWQYDDFNEILVPISKAVDGVEYKEDLTEYEYKHLPDEIDAGITGGSPAYKGKSIARRILNIVNGQIILMDHNNSSLDFQVIDKPTPGWIE